MLSNCLKCRNNTDNKKTKVVRNKDGRIMVTSNRVVCSSENQDLLKEQEASELLSSLAIRTPSSEIPVVGPILF